MNCFDTVFFTFLTTFFADFLRRPIMCMQRPVYVCVVVRLRLVMAEQGLAARFECWQLPAAHFCCRDSYRYAITTLLHLLYFGYSSTGHVLRKPITTRGFLSHLRAPTNTHTHERKPSPAHPAVLPLAYALGPFYSLSPIAYPSSRHHHSNRKGRRRVSNSPRVLRSLPRCRSLPIQSHGEIAEGRR